MDIVSLFDGIACAYVAIKKTQIPVKSYKSYEIDKYASTIAKKNHPSIETCGNVNNLKEKINCDILIGGSPCTDLSVANKDRKGLKGDRSSLFWEYVRIKQLLNPKWFILENVASMKEEDRDTITQALGVNPIMIDAGLVSAQRRKRLFWTNIPTTIPENKQIRVKDILQNEVDEKYYVKTSLEGKKGQGYRVYPIDGKSVTITANGGGLGAKTGLYKVEKGIRRLTPLECERLQGLPDNYTEGISDTQRYKCCGNAFNIDVIAHILAGIERSE